MAGVFNADSWISTSHQPLMYSHLRMRNFGERKRVRVRERERKKDMQNTRIFLTLSLFPTDMTSCDEAARDQRSDPLTGHHQLTDMTSYGQAARHQFVWAIQQYYSLDIIASATPLTWHHHHQQHHSPDIIISKPLTWHHCHQQHHSPDIIASATPLTWHHHHQQQHHSPDIIVISNITHIIIIIRNTTHLTS